MNDQITTTRICYNDECALFDKPAPADVSHGYVSPFCAACHRPANVVVERQGHKFSSYAEFEKYAGGLAVEHKLLKRLVIAKAANPEDVTRVAQAEQFLADLTCSCCKQPFIPIVETPTPARQDK